MKLTFFGAAKTVTGSKYLLEVSGKRYLIDCGLFQGLKQLRQRNWEPLPVDPKSIDAVVLTHAHIDHTGYLPLLVKQGFNGKIYCTNATKEITEILLKDAGHLQEEDARMANKYGYSVHKPALPLYTEEDSEVANKRLFAVDYHEKVVLNEKCSFEFLPSGHILGSAFIIFCAEESQIVFSGDLGRPHEPLLQPPEKIHAADYLILESTYGNRLHKKLDVVSDFSKIINDTIARGGSIIIPSFAVGRAQTLLYYLYMLQQNGSIPKVPIFLDSPMAVSISRLWKKYECDQQQPKEICDGIFALPKYVSSREESKQLNYEKEPAIIISASGMAEGGRVLYHIEHFGPDEKNTILFAGYQAEGTRGDRILRGEKEVKIHGKMVPIRAKAMNLSEFSSHADYEETLDWLKGFEKAPKAVFLTHGEPDASTSLKIKIQEAFGWNVIIPDYKESFTLS